MQKHQHQYNISYANTHNFGQYYYWDIMIFIIIMGEFSMKYLCNIPAAPKRKIATR